MFKYLPRRDTMNNKRREMVNKGHAALIEGPIGWNDPKEALAQYAKEQEQRKTPQPVNPVAEMLKRMGLVL